MNSGAVKLGAIGNEVKSLYQNVFANTGLLYRVCFLVAKYLLINGSCPTGSYNSV